MLTHGFHVPKHDFHNNSLQQEEKVQMALLCDTQHRLPCRPPLDNTALWHTAPTALSSSTDPALWHPVPKALSSPTESLLLLLTMQLWVVLQAVVVTAWSWKLHQGAKSVNESKWPSSHSDEMSRVRIATTRSFFCMISVWKLLDFICVHKDWIKKSHMPSMCFVSKPQSQHIRLKGSNIFTLVMGYVEKFSLGFHTP